MMLMVYVVDTVSLSNIWQYIVKK